MPRRSKTIPAPQARAHIDVLTAQLRQSTPTANLLQEARRTLEEPAPPHGERPGARAELLDVFERRLAEAMDGPGDKSAHLLACVRQWERHKASKGAAPEGPEDRARRLDESLGACGITSLPFMGCRMPGGRCRCQPWQSLCSAS